jgi:hypothetical protein
LSPISLRETEADFDLLRTSHKLQAAEANESVIAFMDGRPQPEPVLSPVFEVSMQALFSLLA